MVRNQGAIDDCLQGGFMAYNDYDFQQMMDGLAKIDKAKLGPQKKLAAQMLLSCIRLLKEMAKAEPIAIEDIDADFIINLLRKGDNVRR
jgi:hypothetical protein